MMKYFEWCCYHLISIDWKTWNYFIDTNHYINVALSIVWTVHMVLIFALVGFVMEWWISRRMFKLGYTEGYKDGVVSKAVKLGKLKFGEAPQGIVLYEIGREEYSNEVECAFREHQKKDT